MSDRKEFSAKVRKSAWERAYGRCEICTAKLFPGKFAFDHIRPDGLGGEAVLDNCQCICSSCHHRKTVEQDRPPMQKADNIRNKHLGLGEKKRPWSNFKKKMNGEVVRR